MAAPGIGPGPGVFDPLNINGSQGRADPNAFQHQVYTNPNRSQYPVGLNSQNRKVSGTGSGTGRGGRPSNSPTGPTPFDPEYYANVANYLFKTNNSIGADLETQALDRTALAGGLGQLQYAQPRAELAQMEKANQMGALYSTPYAQSIGDIGNQYAQKEGTLANTYGGKLAALAAQVAALRGSIPLYENQQALASAQRLAAAAAKNKGLGEKTSTSSSAIAANSQQHALGRGSSGGRGRFGTPANHFGRPANQGARYGGF